MHEAHARTCTKTCGARRAARCEEVAVAPSRLHSYVALRNRQLDLAPRQVGVGEAVLLQVERAQRRQRGERVGRHVAREAVVLEEQHAQPAERREQRGAGQRPAQPVCEERELAQLGQPAQRRWDRPAQLVVGEPQDLRDSDTTSSSGKNIAS